MLTASRQITQDQANAGTTPVRSNPFQGTCNGKSTAGGTSRRAVPPLRCLTGAHAGVFWRSECSERTDMDVNVITTSLFETLSAYLAEATGDAKYTAAAQAAYGFVTTHLMQAEPNIPIDTLKMADCGTNDWIFTYNTGKFVEGAVVLSHVTGDDAYKNQALKTIVDAVTKTPNWQDEQGHITEGQGGDPTTGGTNRQFKSARSCCVCMCAATDGCRHLPARPDRGRPSRVPEHGIARAAQALR